MIDSTWFLSGIFTSPIQIILAAKTKLICGIIIPLLYAASSFMRSLIWREKFQTAFRFLESNVVYFLAEYLLQIESYTSTAQGTQGYQEYFLQPV